MMAVSIATGSFRLSCPCYLSSGRHTGMRSFGMMVMPAKDGRSASAAANCLYQAAIGNSTAPTAALLFPGTLGRLKPALINPLLGVIMFGMGQRWVRREGSQRLK